MKRRQFIQTLGVLGCTPALARMDWLFPKDSTIHLFHTNDTHSRIDPFPMSDKRNGGKAGVARRATLFKKFREQYAHTLFLDAGDTFQGTPYFNYYEGKLEYRLMSELGYDVVTLGNHDFDSGVDKLLAAMEEARFEFVVANYEITNPLLRARVNPYRVVEKAGVRAGIFGLSVTFKGLVTADNHKGVTYQDPVATAHRTATHLRTAEKCQVVICLSHLGIDGASGEAGDIHVANQVSGIDVIIGGHSHTFMDSPLMVTGPDGWQTLIHQVGFAGLRVGHVMLSLDRAGGVIATGGHYEVG